MQTEHCRNPSGRTPGRVCARCAGSCVLCRSDMDAGALSSNVTGSTYAPVAAGGGQSWAYLCDMCSSGRTATACIVCDYHDAATPGAFCARCCMLERDRDGCPRVTNASASRPHRSAAS
eukprot:TRINITY_DN7653_c0_g1_i1.p1 TRINITY_DN7653_c0_g1~~TRINITY_DN7653_c0_g1_i1.p1  ORF type:complete len:119 (+),score=2.78 TRINITY_DN7653_c0_g1_i1:159-515(+)